MSDSESTSYETTEEEYASQQSAYGSNRTQQQQQQQQPPLVTNAPTPISSTAGNYQPTGNEENNSKPTQEEFHSAIFAVCLNFKPRDLLRQGKLLDNGKIRLSVDSGQITRLWCSHIEDFEKHDQERMHALMASINSNNNGGVIALGKHQHHGKKKKKRMQSGTDGAQYYDGSGGGSGDGGMGMQERSRNITYSDIVQMVALKDLTTTWPHEVCFSFPTIERFKNEGYRPMSQNIEAYFIANKLNAKRLLSHVVCDRTITNGNIKFRTLYPKATVASLDKDVEYVRGKAYIDCASPFISIFNKAKFGNAKITGPSPHLKEQNQYMMEEAEARKWMKIAKNEISQHMSFGDVTKNFCVDIELPMPFYRQKDHQLFLAGNPDGVQFQGFVDKEFVYRGQDLATVDPHNTYLDKYYKFNFEIHTRFLPGTHS